MRYASCLCFVSELCSTTKRTWTDFISTLKITLTNTISLITTNQVDTGRKKKSNYLHYQIHPLRKKALFSISKVAQKLKQKQSIRIRMEDNIISVHMDYRNQRRTYTSNTDSVLRITYQKRRKREEYKNSRRKFRQEF